MARCTCSEAKRPFADELPAQSNDRPRQWFVLRRNVSRSAFNGYREMWSASSSLHCRVCGEHWDSKAAYVSRLSDCEFFPQQTAPKVEPYG